MLSFFFYFLFSLGNGKASKNSIDSMLQMYFLKHFDEFKGKYRFS